MAAIASGPGACEGLHDLAVAEQRRITLDVSQLRCADFAAVAIVAGALVRIRQIGAEVAVCPPSSGAYRVLKRADLETTRAQRFIAARSEA